MRPLVALSAVLLVLLAGHDVTHAVDDGLRTGLGELALVAVPQWIVLAVVMAVMLRADRAWSALAALALGAGVVVGVVSVHLVPFALAPYDELDPSAASWALAWAPVAVGLVLAALAGRQWRAAGG